MSLLLLSTISQAAFKCTVDVSAVLIYADGAVNIRHSGRGVYTVICNLNTPRDGVAVTTCAVIATYNGAPTPVYIGDV